MWPQLHSTEQSGSRQGRAISDDELKNKQKKLLGETALELGPERWVNFSMCIQEEKPVGANVEWCQDEKARVVECQVVWNVDIYIETSGR